MNEMFKLWQLFIRPLEWTDSLHAPNSKKSSSSKVHYLPKAFLSDEEIVLRDGGSGEKEIETPRLPHSHLAALCIT